MDHETACDAPCSTCKSDWTCPYINIGCSLPRNQHFCPKCDPDPTTCRECGMHSEKHLLGCSKYTR